MPESKSATTLLPERSVVDTSARAKGVFAERVERLSTLVTSAVDPVTFDGDGVGSVHRYADHDSVYLSTACGIGLTFDHAVVSPSSTEPLCTECFA
jgi:hypothetical protein